MVKIRKYANVVERFLHGEKGQRFFNFAYSIGAAIVIWGALFKILHLPGGNTLLCIGMGTEIAMFILTAFDRPPREYHWEDVFPAFDTKDPDDRPNFAGGNGSGVVIAGSINNAGQSVDVAGQPDATGAAAITGSGGVIISGSASGVDAMSMAEMQTIAEANKNYLEGMQSIAEQMERLSETTKALNEASEVLLRSCSSITGNSETISQNSEGYIDRMADLNRNIAGLNTIYEIQLKSVSSQLETIDRVNRSMKDIRDMYEKSANESSRYCEETEKMARYMKQLNAVYEKMITAMTINMQNPMMGGPSQSNPFADRNS